MVQLLEFIGFWLELIAFLSFFVVVYYIYKIEIMMKKEYTKIWGIIALGFLLIIFRRGISFILPYIEDELAVRIISTIIIPSILLTVSILLIVGFYQFSKICERTCLSKR